MKSLTRFLVVALCMISCADAHAVVSSTLGSNLTGYNGASGARDNNNWNSLTNGRASATGTAAKADFGNCNALILRCATPKCATGGCTTMDVASAIVAGCVQSNTTCKQYGDDLVQYISAQLVASSNAKASQQAAAAEAAAAQSAAAQSAQQIQQMQMQMQQMQSQMAAQNAETVAQLQNALAEQKQLTAQAIADATVAQSAATAAVSNPNMPLAIDGLSATQVAAASRGVSDDILAREQITGQIMSSIDNVEASLKTLKATMKNVFDYAGCDSRGNNCTGPKRVKTFKAKAEQFFEPYEVVLDELENALISAQTVGVDITDIYMMLSGSCNSWGQYMCTGKESLGVYTSNNCRGDRTIAYSDQNGENATKAGQPCTLGAAITPEVSPRCTLIKTLSDAETDTVRREWLEPETGDDTMIRIGCASSALDASKLFGGRRKKQASIDIEILQNIIAQDAPEVYGSRWGNATSAAVDGVKYCVVGQEFYNDLQKIVSQKTLPQTICVRDVELNRIRNNQSLLLAGDTGTQHVDNVMAQCNSLADNTAQYNQCLCKKGGGTWGTQTTPNQCVCDSDKTWDNGNLQCVDESGGSQAGGVE